MAIPIMQQAENFWKASNRVSRRKIIKFLNSGFDLQCVIPFQYKIDKAGMQEFVDCLKIVISKEVSS